MRDDAKAAAEIVIAMIRFAQSELPSVAMHADGDEEHFAMQPLGRGLKRQEMIEALTTLPKPVLVIPALPRGTVAVWSAADFSVSQRQRMDYETNNQVAGIAEMIGTDAGTAEPRILLATGLDRLVFDRAVLREWASTYGVGMGWNLRRCADGMRADYEMALTDGTGRWTHPPRWER